jgi:hypothetical protein
MKPVAVLVVAGLAFWFVGSRIVDRGEDVNAVAQASKNNISNVTGVLRQAIANAQKQGSGDETTWQGQTNAECERTAEMLSGLGTPRSADEIARYLGKALPMVRSLHQRLGTLPPPNALAEQASKAGRALLKQEDLLGRVYVAARHGNTTQMLNQVKRLRTLARNENPNLVKLGLTECTLPSWGVPL